MNGTPKIGHTHERTFTVAKEQLIIFADDQMPAVLSTPSLLLEMERTARELLEPWLKPDERSVGTEVSIKHSAPSLEGFKVTCLARVLAVNGDEIHFQIEASDEHDLLSRGFHKRTVVNVDRLRKRVNKKAQRDAK